MGERERMKDNQVYYAEARYERPLKDKVFSAVLGILFLIGIFLWIQKI